MVSSDEFRDADDVLFSTSNEVTYIAFDGADCKYTPGDCFDPAVMTRIKLSCHSRLFNATSFDQIPELLDDIIIPDYCSFGDSVDINIWIGPSENVSSPYFDPKSNIFAK
ncbi:Uncharacterized protein BM_BM17199 [Brugia malayi]|uniref:Uncharacterized protein n=1 Tax=Brugia malayi TaxID=6279 RepID=A0A4E9FUC0_BRUMA|nr:Uncharacterized protein BM_BM17199 [Brugia malayi]VIP00303.1 Uncharacterized protein BM_BM17199 [Brugia malayi]